MKYVYRAVNALLGVLTLISAFFVGFIKIKLETSDKLAETIYDISGKKASGIAVGEEFSIYRFIRFFTGKDDLSFMLPDEHKLFLWPKEFAPINARIIVFAVFFALILATGIFLIIYSCFGKKRLPVFIAGLCGIVFDIVMMNTFRSAAREIYNGTVDVLGYVFDNGLGSGILAMLAGSAAKSAFQLNLSLCGLQNAFMMIFIAVAVWSLIFYAVDIGDPKAKQEQEAEKAAKLAKKEQKKAAKAAKKAGNA
ncbi:MAG: hypothetical protein IKH65_06105 [Clostridia bacterium]|nr:hypothetical protein [Clostridia bacterium]